MKAEDRRRDDAGDRHDSACSRSRPGTRAGTGGVRRVLDQAGPKCRSRARPRRKPKPVEMFERRRFSIVLSTIHQTPSHEQREPAPPGRRCCGLSDRRERGLCRLLCARRDMLHGHRGSPCSPLFSLEPGRPERMRPRPSALDQRIGRPYCRPSLVHRALMPRAILSGLPEPTLRSKISP